jgi:hypothetical protein
MRGGIDVELHDVARLDLITKSGLEMGGNTRIGNWLKDKLPLFEPMLLTAVIAVARCPCNPALRWRQRIRNKRKPQALSFVSYSLFGSSPFVKSVRPYFRRPILDMNSPAKRHFADCPKHYKQVV